MWDLLTERESRERNGDIHGGVLSHFSFPVRRFTRR